MIYSQSLGLGKVRVPMTTGAMYAFPSVKLPPKAIEETAQWSFFFSHAFKNLNR